jgi:hypothetical protein
MARGNVTGVPLAASARPNVEQPSATLAWRAARYQGAVQNHAAIQCALDQRAYWLGLFFRPFISTADNKVLNFTDSPFDFGEG